MSTPQSFDEHRRVTTGTYIAGAILGAITGGFLAYVACSIFEAGSPLREICTMVVASLNAALNIRTAHRAAFRQKAFDEVSESLGFLDASDVSQEVELRLRQMLGHVDSFELHEARKKAFGDAVIVLGEIEWRGERTDADRRGTVYRRTVWYFEDPGRDLPAFVLKPDSWILVAALDVSLAEAIDFSDRPEFMKSYQVSADDVHAVRHLFNHELFNFLEQHPGLEVLARNDRLAVFRSGGLVPAGEIDDFIETAMQVARLIGMAEKSTRPVSLPSATVPDHAVPPVVPPRWTRASSRVYAEQQYRYDVQQFLDHPPPRTIPWRVAQRHQGCVTVLLMLWSCGFLLGGIGLALQSLNSPNSETWFIACGMGLGFVLIGSTVFFFSWRYRNIRGRILTWGESRPARVLSITPTQVYINKSRRHDVRLETVGGTSQRTVIAPVYSGREVDRAEFLRQSGDLTHVLIYVDHPNHCIWIDHADIG